MSPHVLFHGTALAARVVAELAAKGFVAGMNALVNLEFVDAIEGLFTFATNERLFPRVDQQMPLQVLRVFRHVYTTFEDRVEGGSREKDRGGEKHRRKSINRPTNLPYTLY